MWNITTWLWIVVTSIKLRRILHNDGKSKKIKILFIPTCNEFIKQGSILKSTVEYFFGITKEIAYHKLAVRICFNGLCNNISSFQNVP